ncbi:MAG TPA: ORF6N domain-containing protein [Anaeromyxobacteraceae bacterium]|nr:ORF6N domain-containing protein [Anaeromyxobacteraceae bacterium]
MPRRGASLPGVRATVHIIDGSAQFCFQLTAEEAARLRSQTVILDAPRRRGVHRKYRPHAFTEHGVAILSSVLRSHRAVQVNIEIGNTHRESLAGRPSAKPR